MQTANQISTPQVSCFCARRLSDGAEGLMSAIYIDGEVRGWSWFGFGPSGECVEERNPDNIKTFLTGYERCAEKPVNYNPMMVSFAADNFPAVIPEFNAFSITKNKCCTLDVETNAGTFTLGQGIGEFCPEKFDCTLDSFSIQNVIPGSGMTEAECLSSTTIFLQRT